MRPRYGLLFSKRVYSRAMSDELEIGPGWDPDRVKTYLTDRAAERGRLSAVAEAFDVAAREAREKLEVHKAQDEKFREMVSKARFERL